MGQNYIEIKNFSNNNKKSRFEFKIYKHLAYVDYIFQSQSLTLINTFIPKELHNQDKIGEKFITKIVEYVDLHSLSLSSNCPYASALLKNIETSSNK